MAEWETISKKSDGWENLSNDGWETIDSPKTKKASWSDNIEIGLKNLGHMALDAGQLAAGGIASLAGNTEQADVAFGDYEKRNAEWEKNLKDYGEQSTGGKIVSGLTSLVPTVAAMPFVGPAPAMGVLSGMSALSGGGKNIQAGASSGQAVAQAIGEGALDMTAAKFIPQGAGILKGAGYGAAGNLVSQAGIDTLGQAILPKSAQAPYQYDPEKYIVSGATGALPGAVIGGMTGKAKPKEAGGEKPTPEQDFTPGANGAPSTGILHQVGIAKKYAENGLAETRKMQEEILNTIQDGDASPHVLVALEEVEAKIKKYEDDIAQASALLDNPTKPVTDETGQYITDMQRQYDRINAAQAGRPGRGIGGPIHDIPPEVQHGKLNAIDDANTRPKEPFFDRDGNIVPDTIPDIETPKQAIEPTPPKQPKTPPYDVAITKIGEAMRESIDKVKQRLYKAQEALETLPKREYRDESPGSHYSALKAALELEIRSYEDLINGMEPRLEAEPIPEETPLPKLLEEPVVEQAAPHPDAGVIKQGTWESPADIAFKKEQENRALLSKQEPETYTREEYLAKFGKEPKKYPKEDDGSAPMDARLGKPEYAIANAKRQIENLEKALIKVRDALNGENTPSGSIDPGALQNKQAQLEFLLNKWNNVLDYHRSRIDPSDAGAPARIIEAEVAPQKYDSVQDAIDKTKTNEDTSTNTSQMVEAFHDNPDLFNKKSGTNISFDKRLDTEVSPRLTKMLSHLLDVTRLGKEKIFFVLDDSIGGGQVSFSGNTIVVHINPNWMKTRLQEAESKGVFTKFLGEGKIREAYRDYSYARIAAHELGHVALVKYLRDFTTHTDDLLALERDWQQHNKDKTGRGISITDIGSEKKRDKYQDAFHEFFAERVARNLMLKYVTGAFDKRSKGYLGDINKIIESSAKYLKERGVSFEKRDFADTILRDILNDSQDYIRGTSKEASDRLKLISNDKAILAQKAYDPEAFPFYKKSLQEAYELHHNMQHLDMFHKGGGDMLQMRDPSPEPMISTRAATSLGHGIARNVFANTTLSKVFRDNPVIQQAYKIVRDAEIKADRVNSKLWFGEVSRDAWNKAKPWQKISKIKAEASAYFQLKRASNEDASVVHDLFKKGFEDEISYEQNKAQNGSHLTEKQSKLYDALAKMFKGQYQEVLNIQASLDKNKVIPYREGWYPSVRSGQYYIDVGFRGNTTYRQHFRSKVEADLFIKNLGEQAKTILDISQPTKVGDDKPMSDLFGGIQMAQDIISQKFPGAAGPVADALKNAQANIINKGGTLGGHHKFRSNLSGYLGSELLATNKERGNNFKKAIQQSVTDYSGGIRKMMIQHYGENMLLNGKYDEATTATVRQMFDSALNRVPENILEKLDSGIKETWDKSVLRMTGKLKADGTDSYNHFYGTALEMFYLTKLMSKIVFPVGQVLSAASAIREMSHTGGYIKPYISYAKGLAKLATGNKELKDVLYKVSQESNTFEPQFMEALHLSEVDSKLWNNIKTYALLNEVNKGADSLSRVMTFTAMLDMYQSMGVSKEAAIRKAMDDTNATMVAYGSTETAPVFNKLGLLGNAIKPLQTYGQAQLGNWVSDFRKLLSTNPNDWAPMLNYTLVTTALGGALSPLFIQEYEIIRSFLDKHFPEFAPPAILELAKIIPDFFDGVFEDPAAIEKAMMYGIPSATSGIDIASSTRANQTFLTTVGAVLTAQEDWTKLVPLLSFGSGVVSGAATLAKSAVSPDVTPAEKRQAFTDALPAGHISYAAKELAGVNTTKVGGKETNTPMVAGGKSNEAIVPRTDRDIISGYMGTKSTKEKYESDVSRIIQEREKQNKERVQKLYDLVIANPFGTDISKKRLQKLIDLGETEEGIENNLGSEAFKQNVGVIKRLIANKTGVPETPATARKLKQIFNFKAM